MIKRYSRKQLTDIWSEENKYKIWLDVEIAATEAMEKLGQIPKGVSSVVRKKAKINVNRIHKIESEVKHDVIAFLTSVTEKTGIKTNIVYSKTGLAERLQAEGENSPADVILTVDIARLYVYRDKNLLANSIPLVVLKASTFIIII